MAKSELFFGGVPTKPDVDKIRQKWPAHNLEIGQVIPYRAVAELIGESVRSNRFRSVTLAWRKSVEPDHFIGCDGEGNFVVLSEGDKLALGQTKMRYAGRAVRRSIVITSLVDVKKLSQEQREDHRRLQDRQAKIRAALQIRGSNGNGQAPSLLAEVDA